MPSFMKGLKVSGLSVFVSFCDACGTLLSVLVCTFPGRKKAVPVGKATGGPKVTNALDSLSIFPYFVKHRSFSL